MFRRTLVAILVLAASAGTSHAVEVPTAAGTREILFRFDGLSALRLSGFEGGVGVRMYLRDGLALRPALRCGFSWQRTRPDPVPPGTPTPSLAKEIDTSVGLDIALEKHLHTPGSISPYLGASVGGLYANDKTYPSLVPGPPAGTITKITAKETDGSLLGLFGVEWGCTQSLTLGVETRFGLRVTTRKKEREAVMMPDHLYDDIVEYAVGFETTSLVLGVRW
jgi:hypothetical protein